MGKTIAPGATAAVAVLGALVCRCHVSLSELSLTPLFPTGSIAFIHMCVHTFRNDFFICPVDGCSLYKMVTDPVPVCRLYV